MGTAITVQNIAGGYLVWIMMNYSFIADNSLPRDRVLRLGAVSFCYTARLAETTACPGTGSSGWGLSPFATQPG